MVTLYPLKWKLAIVIELLFIGITIGFLLYRHETRGNLNQSYCRRNGQRPVLLMIAIKTTIHESYWDDIRDVFDRLGYRLAYETINETHTQDEWDVLWDHNYPFNSKIDQQRKLDIVMTPLPYQKINHMTGINVLTVKALLLQRGGKYIPAAYYMPQDNRKFLDESQQRNVSSLWIQKNPNHRGVLLKHLKDLQLDQKSIIQEYVEDPLLFDGHKFNLGIYVVLTSIDPLRAYILNSTSSARFSGEKYSPGNYTDPSSYNADLDPKNVDDIPSLKWMVELAYTRWNILRAHLRLRGLDFSIVLDEAQDAIRDILTTREVHLRRNIPPSLIDRKNSLFEITRWDFLIDADFKVHLMEINMSPQMHAFMSVFKPYVSHVLFNLFSVAGISHTGKHASGNSLLNSIRDSDLNVESSICFETKCRNCDDKSCIECLHCMSREEKNMIKMAYAEHINRQNMRRVYPEEMTREEAVGYNISDDVHLSDNDQLMRAWYRAKCISSFYWCR